MTPYYQDDLVTLYHGDCRELLQLLNFDVIVTDPPYGVSWKVGSANDPHRGMARARRGRDFAPIIGDDEPFDPSLLLAFGKPMALFGANHYADRLPASPSWIVWDKRVHDWTNDQADCELVWTNLGGVARVFRLLWSGGARPREDTTSHLVRVEHPTQKPLSLMRWILARCPSGTVMDPYAGSGSTLVAAKSIGRRSVGIEIDEGYCERAARRLSQEVLGLSA